MRLLVALLALLLAACCPLCPGPRGDAPAGGPTPRELAERAPLAAPGTYRLRLSFVLEHEGLVLPMAGLADVDTAARRARLAGLADSGLTLLDLELDPAGHRVAGGIEPFRRDPAVAAFAARALRRIFLDPAPRAGDTFTRRGARRSLSRWDGDARIEFAFSEEGILRDKTAALGDDWVVRYREPRDFDGLTLPSRIEYREGLSRGSFTLRIEAARRIDHGP